MKVIKFLLLISVLAGLSHCASETSDSESYQKKNSETTDSSSGMESAQLPDTFESGAALGLLRLSAHRIPEGWTFIRSVDRNLMLLKQGEKDRYGIWNTVSRVVQSLEGYDSEFISKSGVFLKVPFVSTQQSLSYWLIASVSRFAQESLENAAPVIMTSPIEYSASSTGTALGLKYAPKLSDVLLARNTHFIFRSGKKIHIYVSKNNSLTSYSTNLPSEQSWSTLYVSKEMMIFGSKDTGSKKALIFQLNGSSIQRRETNLPFSIDSSRIFAMSKGGIIAFNEDAYRFNMTSGVWSKVPIDKQASLSLTKTELSSLESHWTDVEGNITAKDANGNLVLATLAE